MKLSEELIYRGFKAETTIKDPKELDTRPSKKFYWGADPSADSLTIGNLAAMMMCACFIRHGYQPYILVGGATGQIGDPKENSERELKPLAEVEHGKTCLEDQIRRIFSRAAAIAPAGQNDPTVPSNQPAEPTKPAPLTIVDNLDWFKNLNYLDFLREIGKAFSMTQLLDRQFVQNRIGPGGSGISYAEFSYTLIQGYDFLHLYRQYGINLELCGADQYGNCASGIHLIRRLENATADVWSTPLIIDPVSGKKFGKSEGNAIWLAASNSGSENYTSIFDFYQFWLGQPDLAVENMLKIYTIFEPAQIDEIMQKHRAAPEQRLAQKALARAVTSIVHGPKNAAAVENLSTLLFDKNTDFTSFSADEITEFAAFFPTLPLNYELVAALVNSGLAPSKKKAREFLAAGAISINGEKVHSDPKITQPALIKKGKNKFLVVK